MEIIQISYPLSSTYHSSSPLVVAMGFFDGVHLGHCGVIEYAKHLAEKQGAAVGIITFSPHPQEVLAKEQYSFRYLTPLPVKLTRFAAQGLEKAFVIEFTPEFASLGKEAFLDEILAPLGVTGVVTGFNFTFGRYGAGTPEDLLVLGKDRFETVTVPPILREGTPISSTRIRTALEAGEISEVNQMLGRPYHIAGIVVHGDKRGRQLGFPTANLALEHPCYHPRLGVYVVDVWIPELKLSKLGVMNVGIRPTFTDTEPAVRFEVHLLETDLDLYDKVLEVDLLHFLRPEKRFPSLEHLKDQLHQDREEAYQWNLNREQQKK